MSTLYFATTNQEKVQIARTVCADTDLQIEPVALEIDEIQGEDSERIVRDKVRRAYEQLGKPVVVSDDSWDIPALGGFPGPYMKSLNYWFTPKDFLRLMDGVQDRTIILHQFLAYTDGSVTQVFRNDIPGQVAHESRGDMPGFANMSVTVLDSDGGKTIAEVFKLGRKAVSDRYNDTPDAWHGFLEWYTGGRNFDR